MIVSSAFALKEATTIPDNLVDVSETKLEEGYYFNSSLNFLLECQEELLSYRRDYYKTILETSEDETYLINESFNDLMTKMKAIIKKIIAYIETLVKRFVTQLAKFVKSDKYIIKMKKDLDKFTDEDKFKISGYNFTIKDEVPVVHVVGLDLGQFESELKSIDSSNPEKKIAKLAEIVADLNEAKMDDIRGQILNVNNPITESSFANELFCIYRDGQSDEISIEIKKADVRRASIDFEGYNDKIKSVKRLETNIKSQYKDIEKKIDGIVTASIKIDGDSTINVNLDNGITSTEYRHDLMNILNKLIDKQINQIQRIANLHTLAFATKLDALNALTLQDRNILYTALSKVQKNINNTRTMRESLDLSIDETCSDYTREANYRQFVTEKYFMNMNQKHFVEECLALSESNISELKSINEDLKMDTKNKFDKQVQLLKEIYQKFLIKMNKFITINDGFLKKYKDIILTKKVSPYTLNNMPDYEAGIKNVKAHKLQKLDIKSMLSESETDIQKKILPAFDGDGDFTDFAKRYFLCDNKPNKEKTSSETLDMKEIYAFCINPKAAMTTLENDLRDFTAAANSAKTAVMNSTPKNESMSLIGEKYYYSSVLESYINEDGEAEAQKSTTITSDNKAQNANSNAKLKLDVPEQDTKAKENKDLDKQVKSNDKGKDDKTQAEENKDADKKKIEDTADWYLKTIKTVCTAKITAFQKIYSEYMKILRYHVKEATGSLGNAGNFKEEDVNNIKEAMKQYKNAKTDEEKNTAAQKIINIYKSKNMVIDAHDVQKLVDKNSDALG